MVSEGINIVTDWNNCRKTITFLDENNMLPTEVKRTVVGGDAKVSKSNC